MFDSQYEELLISKIYNLLGLEIGLKALCPPDNSSCIARQQFMMGYITSFLYSQLFVTPPYPDFDFSGQTVVVTGSNVGLGFEAARHFLRLRAAKVILAVRSIHKGEKAAADLTKSTNATTSCVEVWFLDLSDYTSIKAFAARVEGLDRLDAVVQNAGILTTKYEVINSQESTITVNLIGAVLLGLSVLPKLRDSAAKHGVQGRMTFVGSGLLHIAKFKEKNDPGSLFDALASKEKADMNDRSA